MMRVAVAIIVVLLSVVGSGPKGPVPAVHAQSPTWSTHCHVTDGTFSTCPDGSKEWSDVTPKYFSQSNSYLYADQAKLNASLPTPPPTDTLVLLYDECAMTKALGPDQYFLVSFPTVETENGLKVLNHYVIHIFTDGTIVFIENGVPQGPTTGLEPYRVSTIEGMKGGASFGPSPNCPTSHVMAEFQIPLSAAGGDSYSPDPLYWSASIPDQPPIASFISSPANPVAGQNVGFDASASYDPDGTVVSYSWSFGDGQGGAGEFPILANTNPGSYTVSLTVTDNGSPSASDTLAKTIKVAPVPPAFDYSLSVSPASGSVTVGATAQTSSAIVTATLTAGIPQGITLSSHVSGPSNGVSVFFTPASITPATTGASAFVTITVSPVALIGTYLVTISGNPPGASAFSATFTLVVTTSFDYSLGASPATLNVTIGGAGSTEVTTATLLAGNPQIVSFGISGLPAYVTATPSDPASCSPTCSSSVDLTASSLATPTSGATITFTGTSSSGVVKTATFILVVKAPTNAFDYSLAWSPPSASVVVGNNATTSVLATLTSGSAVSQTCTITSAAVTGLAVSVPTFSITPASPSASQSEKISTSASTPPSPPAGYSIGVSCSGGGVTRTASFVLVVNAHFDYSLSASPPSLTLLDGGSGRSETSTATLLSGTSESVSFSISNLPPGVTASFFSPTSCNPTCSTSVILTASFNATPTSGVIITVKGTSVSGIVKTATFTLVVQIPTVHDVAVTAVSVSPTSVVGGASVTIFVTVKNTGNVAESGIAVEAIAQSPTTLVPFHTTIGSLNPGASENVSFVWGTPTASGSAGVYTISGLAALAAGETDPTPLDNSRIDGTVTVSSGNQPPIASFTFLPEIPLINQTIVFNATLSSDPNPSAHITNYRWDFGDGSNTNSSVPTVGHSYRSAASYLVSLTVVDSLGLISSSSMHSVTVTRIPYVPGIKVGDWAKYSFSGNVTSFGSANPILITLNVTSVHGSVINGTLTFLYSNGTAISQPFSTDVANAQVTQFVPLFLAANLTAGDPPFSPPPLLKLKNTIFGVFLGGSRQTKGLIILSP